MIFYLLEACDIAVCSHDCESVLYKFCSLILIHLRADVHCDIYYCEVFVACISIFTLGVHFQSVLITIGWLFVYSVQSISHIVQVLDPDGNGSINFMQFSEGVKRILELQGCDISVSVQFPGVKL